MHPDRVIFNLLPVALSVFLSVKIRTIVSSIMSACVSEKSIRKGSELFALYYSYEMKHKGSQWLLLNKMVKEAHCIELFKKYFRERSPTIVNVLVYACLHVTNNTKYGKRRLHVKHGLYCVNENLA